MVSEAHNGLERARWKTAGNVYFMGLCTPQHLHILYSRVFVYQHKSEYVYGAICSSCALFSALNKASSNSSNIHDVILCFRGWFWIIKNMNTNFMGWSQPRWSRGNVLAPRTKVSGSNPTEVDGFFQDVKILSTCPPGGTLSWLVPRMRFQVR